jgi:hypothetical protein
VLEQALGMFGGEGEEQFEVFAVLQGMFQGRTTRLLAQADGSGGDGNILSPQYSTATAFLQNVEQVGSQTVTDVTHSMHRDTG